MRAAILALAIVLALVGQAYAVTVADCIDVTLTNEQPDQGSGFILGEVFVQNNCSEQISELQLTLVLRNSEGHTTSFSVAAATPILHLPPIPPGGFFTSQVAFQSYGQTYDEFLVSVRRITKG